MHAGSGKRLHVHSLSLPATEYYDPLGELWGKPAPPPLARENASLAPVKRADVSADLLARIEAGTRIDAELYDCLNIEAWAQRWQSR